MSVGDRDPIYETVWGDPFKGAHEEPYTWPGEDHLEDEDGSYLSSPLPSSPRPSSPHSARPAARKSRWWVWPVCIVLLLMGVVGWAILMCWGLFYLLSDLGPDRR